VFWKNVNLTYFYSKYHNWVVGDRYHADLRGGIFSIYDLSFCLSLGTIEKLTHVEEGLKNYSEIFGR